MHLKAVPFHLSSALVWAWLPYEPVSVDFVEQRLLTIQPSAVPQPANCHLGCLVTSTDDLPSSADSPSAVPDGSAATVTLLYEKNALVFDARSGLVICAWLAAGATSVAMPRNPATETIRAAEE